MPREESPELKRALDRGSGRELPPNRPPGILGDQGLKLRKTDPTDHGLNAGFHQEHDAQLTFLWVLLAFAVFFPLAYVILWRSDKVERNVKIWLSVAMTIVLVAVVAWFMSGGGYGAVTARLGR